MALLRKANDGMHLFWCPGCECAHGLDGTWTITGPETAPTLRPSVHVPGTCHLWVTNGVLEFLPDCSHALAGKQVPMEEF